MTDREANRFSARAARYARVGANMSGVAARIAGARLFGLTLDRGKSAIELAAALGGLKGPIMKVAQLMATIPDALPPEYARELGQLGPVRVLRGEAELRGRITAFGLDGLALETGTELVRIPLEHATGVSPA